MSNTDRLPLIGIVAGEESGQLLAHDLAIALADKLGVQPDLMGIGGTRLEALGLRSLFDPNDIALMGISDVVFALPRLIGRIRQTADAFIAAKPDCIIVIDSPDFSLRVAKRVKAKLPNVPIVKYVAPSVWAWRPGRAQAMAAYIDHVLAVLPFEPDVMAQLGGPPTHYVGHRLMADAALTACWQAQQGRQHTSPDAPINLVVLPGSRKSEVRALLDDFHQTVVALVERGARLSVSLPTLPHLEKMVCSHVRDWPVPVEVTTDRQAQVAAFANADAALAASGTVTLELALAGVPAVSCYRTDLVFRVVANRLLTTWSAALPNLIADRPVINEYYDVMIRPGMLARMIEELADPHSQRRAMTLTNYAQVRERMAVERPAAETAARIVASVLDRTQAA